MCVEGASDLRVQRAGDAGERRLRGQPDAESGRLAVGCFLEVDALGVVHVVVVAALEHVEEQRGVRDGAGERAVDGEAVEGLAPRVRRQPAALGLDPDEVGPRGRDADRAGAVGPEPGGHETRGHGGRRTPAGPARGPVPGPGVAGVAGVRRSGQRPLAELGGVRLADDDRAGLLEASDDLGVLRRRREVARAAEGGRVTGQVGVVLDAQRDAEQWSVLAAGARVVGLGRGPAGVVDGDDAERVERALGGLDGGQGLLGELLARDVTAPECGELPGQRVHSVIVPGSRS